MEMIREMAVWLPLDLYAQVPVLLPWVVRDPKCRPHKAAGQTVPDQWGAPDSDGFQRDDNSLIKGIPKSLQIAGPDDSPLTGKKMGPSFVASHIWREVEGLGMLASRHPKLNSFVPNLVWLPKQISKLSDREGSIIQDMLKTASWSIYRDAAVDPRFRSQVEEIWGLLKPSYDKLQYRLEISLEKSLQFVSSANFVESRKKPAAEVIKFIDSILSQIPQSTKRLSGRYIKGLPLLSREKLTSLRSQVSPFI